MRVFPSNTNIYFYGQRRFISLRDAASLMSRGFGRHGACISYDVESRKIDYKSISCLIDIQWSMVLNKDINIKKSPNGELILLTKDYISLLKQFIDEYSYLIASKIKYLPHFNTSFPNTRNCEIADDMVELIDRLKLLRELSK